MHMVTCIYCGDRFNRDKEAFIQISARRFAHAKCVPEHQKNISKQEQDYNDLINYIKKLYNVPAVLPTVIKQIKDFRQEYGYTYVGMRKSLHWFYELKNNPISKSNNTIGIIPYIYEDVKDYYYHLYLGELAAEEDVSIPPPKSVTIHSPTCVPELQRRELFNLEDDDE